MNYLYLVLFVIVTTFHLIASIKNNKYLRDISKGMILLTLLGFYLESTNEVNWLIVAAILFSWLGDLLLIPHGIPWFAAGGGMFIVSHIFYVLSYNSVMDINKVPIYVIIILAVLFIIAVAIIFSKLKPHLNKAIISPMFVYLLINGCMNCFAYYRLIADFRLGSIITAIGAVLFFVSDTSLFFVRFNKQSVQKSHFLVMLTYSLGELLIILGLVI